MKNKKGQFTVENTIFLIISILVSIVILFSFMSDAFIEFEVAGNELNATGAPLGRLFTADSLSGILVGIMIFLVAVKITIDVKKR